MPISPDPVAQVATVRRLVSDSLSSRRLNPAQAESVLRHEGVVPGAAQWRVFLQRLFLYAGALACAAGVVFFFAFNWQELPRLAKFVLLQAAVAIAALYAWRRGPGEVAGQAGLLGAMLLCGALLAYLGQTYQTGADTYQLFLAWAALILPWAIAARLGAAWALWLGLVNLAVLLYFGRTRSEPLEIFFEGDGGHLLLFWVNGVALLAAEWATRTSPARLLPRFAGVLVLACAAAGLVGWNLGIGAGPHPWLVDTSRMLMLATVFAFLFVYRRRHDMVMLAAAVSALIAIAGFSSWRVFAFVDDDFGALLMLALFLIASSAAAAAWLRHVQRSWRLGASS